MNKTALQVRDAEVRGALAAFVDTGLVKVANQQAFEKLASVVADTLGEEDYNLEKIAATTDYVLGGDQSAPVQEKTAEEKHDLACKAALGELLLMKTAKQIDDATFVKAANQLSSMAPVQSAGGFKNWLKNQGQRGANAGRAVWDFARTHKKPLGIGAAGVAGLAGAGALGKYLYNKYSN